MLSYQHAYHAGGQADLHKHVALTAVLDRLREKEKAFVVIDLHAGHGRYDLESEAAAKTGEFHEGIGRLWDTKAGEIPAPVASLLARLREFNPDGRLSRYPGSPALARAALRDTDRLILNELHPAAIADLKNWGRADERIAIHQRDGLEALAGLMPPTIRRGVVLVDPSYEIKSEYTDIPQGLVTAVRKWPQGTFLIWYPVLPDGRHHALIDAITQVEGEIHLCELTLTSKGTGLQGTGMIAINPPWRYDETMAAAGTWLAAHMTRGGRHTARWLKRTPPAA